MLHFIKLQMINQLIRSFSTHSRNIQQVTNTENFGEAAVTQAKYNL